jgi:hypothetical protein
VNDNPEKTCPFGHTCDKCLLNVELAGIDAATNSPWNRTQCAFVWNVELALENGKQTNSVGGAIESFRNEMVQGNEMMLEHVVRQGLLGKGNGDNS